MFGKVLIIFCFSVTRWFTQVRSMAELRALRLKPQPRSLSNDNPMASTNRSSVNFKLPSNEISEARHKGGIKARDKKITNHFYQGRRNRGARRDGSPSCLFLAGAKGVKVPFSEAEKWLLFLGKIDIPTDHLTVNTRQTWRCAGGPLYAWEFSIIDAHRHSFYPSTTRLYNNLPIELRQCTDMQGRIFFTKLEKIPPTPGWRTWKTSPLKCARRRSGLS